MFVAHQVHFLFIIYVFLYCFASIYYITLMLRGCMLKLHPAQLSYHIYRPPLDISNMLILSSFFFFFKQHYAIQHKGTQEVLLAVSAVIKCPRVSSPTDSCFPFTLLPTNPISHWARPHKKWPWRCVDQQFPSPCSSSSSRVVTTCHCSRNDGIRRDWGGGGGGSWRVGGSLSDSS